MNLEDRVAIVTGGGRGIGRASALLLAELGARIVIIDHGSDFDGSGRDARVAPAVVAEIESRGGEAIASSESVADWDATGRVVDQALERFGRIDILVNTAGTYRMQMLWKMAPEQFKAVVADALFGTFHCLRRVAPHMIERKYGRIVNFVSRAALWGNVGRSAYGAAKGGVYGLSNVVARDLAPHGILVNAVSPAATRTRLVTGALERGLAHGMDPAHAEAVLGIAQEPENVAAVVAFLCSEELAFHGQTLFVQKGMVGVMHSPQIKESLRKEGRWTPQELIDAAGRLELAPLKELH
jgi:NAD(P)-dependent dehydrogenase (short-subunit alcohol dehydrogenase family)